MFTNRSRPLDFFPLDFAVMTKYTKQFTPLTQVSKIRWEILRRLVSNKGEGRSTLYHLPARCSLPAAMAGIPKIRHVDGTRKKSMCIEALKSHVTPTGDGGGGKKKVKERKLNDYGISHSDVASYRRRNEK